MLVPHWRVEVIEENETRSGHGFQLSQEIWQISTFRVVDAADGSEKGGCLRDVHIGGYVWRRRRTRKDHEW